MPSNTSGNASPAGDFSIVQSGNQGGPWGMPPGGGGGGRGNNGGGGGPQGPWGGGGGGRGPGGPGGGGQPPDLDELIARVQSMFRGAMPGGGGGGGGPRIPSMLGGGRGIALLVALAGVVWLGSGFYRVQPDEQGVVLRFGAFNRTALPGLNYHVPWPVERVLRPAVTRINRVEIGYATPGGDSRVVDVRPVRGREIAGRDLPEESLMLTGDENIIDINFAVFWRIRTAADFLFNTRHPELIVKSAAESVMREVIGKTPIQPALTDARARIEAEVLRGVQTILDQYHAGVEVTQVQLQKVDPPAAVIESFRDVQRANTDADRMRNEADAYMNDIVPRARGDAARLLAEAEGAKQVSIVEATGQAQRFLSVLRAYELAKDVTMQRLYLETMQDILSRTPSIIVDEKIQGIVPFLPLGDANLPLRPQQPPAAGSAPAPGATQRGASR
jgi:membrane protease subunit HflK